MKLNGTMNINKTGIRLVKKASEKIEEIQESRQTESSNNKLYAEAGLIKSEYTRKQNGQYDLKIEYSA